MSLAIYRKYRPQALEDLVGQKTVVELLKNTAIKDKISHAYLFYGPRGTGKTTAARILAKIANCETRVNDLKFREKGEPCNTCRPCKEIEEARALDVVEIDAASNRGIDEIRNIKEGIRLSPTSYRYKTYIIDEAHQLTKAASDALLKTLEEPPAHAIFILATTEYDKLPATITSRAQRIHFRKISIPKIVEKLKKIISEENKAKISDDALDLIAVTSEGSLRDAESLLDQVISLEDYVSLESVEKIIGKIGFRKTSELAGEILEGDIKNVLEYLSNIQESGFNLVDLTKDLIHYFRRAVAIKFSPEIEKIFESELSENELRELKKHSELINPEKHIPLIKSLIRAYSEMKYSPFAIIPLEVAIIENLNKE